MSIRNKAEKILYGKKSANDKLVSIYVDCYKEVLSNSFSLLKDELEKYSKKQSGDNMNSLFISFQLCKEQLKVEHSSLYYCFLEWKDAHIKELRHLV